MINKFFNKGNLKRVGLSLLGYYLVGIVVSFVFINLTEGFSISEILNILLIATSSVFSGQTDILFLFYMVAAPFTWPFLLYLLVIGR